VVLLSGPNPSRWSNPWPRLPICLPHPVSTISQPQRLPNALGNADAVLKGAEAECKALKDEIKRRGLLEAAGDSFAIRVSEQISGRLDVQCGSTQHARIC
jgi:hypothetical protein